MHTLIPSTTERSAPWTDYHHHITAEYHQIGISPCIIDGVRGYRVIWRPFLDEPIAYTNHQGGTSYKTKGDNVKTMWFPIVGDVTEAEAYSNARRVAEAVYRTTVSQEVPNVDWQAMARRAGVKIREEYAKPALNGALDRAAALFELGWNDRMVGERLGVDRSTASRWRKKLGLRK